MVGPSLPACLAQEFSSTSPVSRPSPAPRLHSGDSPAFQGLIQVAGRQVYPAPEIQYLSKCGPGPSGPVSAAGVCKCGALGWCPRPEEHGHSGKGHLPPFAGRSHRGDARDGTLGLFTNLLDLPLPSRLLHSSSLRATRVPCTPAPPPALLPRNEVAFGALEPPQHGTDRPGQPRGF